MTKQELRNLCAQLERRLVEVSARKFVEACEEISSYFEACAFAKRDEMRSEQLDKPGQTPRAPRVVRPVRLALNRKPLSRRVTR